jgi:hypothetical protein
VLEFSEISSAAGRDWTDDGQVHEASRPKGGPRNAIRRVPIPPVLVSMIREHVQDHGDRVRRSVVSGLPGRHLFAFDALARASEGSPVGLHSGTD